MLKEMDTRQLRVLRALLEECSVTQAARKLDQSQPNVSLTLRKLREIVGDPILVRSGSKLVPTERGLALLGHVRAVLEGIDKIVGAPAAFDPAVSTAPSASPRPIAWRRSSCRRWCSACVSRFRARR